jgi:hypothetical protein
MTAKQKEQMGAAKRLHSTCRELTGVARPGKTAHDKAKRGG